MAEYHLHGQIISRTDGRSAVAAAAYRAGEALHDMRLDRTFDYTRKHEVDESVILAPEGAPEWLHDRQALWNTVESAERRRNSQLAREIDLGLPLELVRKDPAAAKQVVKDWAQDMFVAEGLVVDVCFHNMKGNNPHAHMMLTMRRLHVHAGEFEEGSRFVFEETKARDLNDWGYMDHWRETWADRAIAAMAKHDIDARIDHRSLVDQGIYDREPGIHVGPTANAMQARGAETNRWEKNAWIWFGNEEPWFEENRRYVAFLDAEAAEERQRQKEEGVRQEAERKGIEAAAAVVARADEFADLKRRLDQAPEGILGDHAIRFYNVAERLEAEAREMAAGRASGLHSFAKRLHAARPSTQVAKERLAGAAKRLDEGIKRVLAGRADRLELAAANLERVRPAFAFALAQARSRAATAAKDLRVKATALAAAAFGSTTKLGAWKETLSSAVLHVAAFLKGASWRQGGRARFVEPDQPPTQAEIEASVPAREVMHSQQHERDLSAQGPSILQGLRSLRARLQRERADRRAKAAAKVAQAAEAALDRNLQLAEAAIRARVDHSGPATEQYFVGEWIRTMKATKGPLEVRYREADRAALRGYALRMNRHPQIGELDRELIRLSPFAGGVDLSARDAPPELPEGMKTDLGRRALYTRHVLWILQELRADREVSEHLRQLLRRSSSAEEDSSQVSHATRGRQTSRFTGKAGFEMGDE